MTQRSVAAPGREPRAGSRPHARPRAPTTAPRLPRLLAASLALALLALALLATPPLVAQDVRTAMVGDTIRIGDVVPVAVRVVLEAGERVAWPDTLPLAGDVLENAARVRPRVDTLADGRLEATALYRVTPWRTGEVPLPELELSVRSGEESVRAVTVSFPVLDVISVLPADTAGIEPRPARGVLGRSWSLGPLLLALLALLALIAAILWWRRRRADRTAAAPAGLAVSPRERVLARLQEVRESGLAERGAMKEFYSRTTLALREYLGALDSEWSEDLTSTELVTRFRSRVGSVEAASVLADLLRQADQVKFARRRPDPDTAVREWEKLREWVLGFGWPPPTLDQRGEAA